MNIPGLTIAWRIRKTGDAPASATSPAPAPTFPGALAALQREGDAVRAELARIDAKAAALMGWAATALAILSAAAGVIRPPLPALLAVAVGGALLAAAVAVLLHVIRPALPRNRERGYGFVRHATAGDTGQLLAMLAPGQRLEDRLAGEVLRQSQLALTKYRRLRRAVDLLLGGRPSTRERDSGVLRCCSEGSFVG